MGEHKRIKDPALRAALSIGNKAIAAKAKNPKFFTKEAFEKHVKYIQAQQLAKQERIAKAVKKVKEKKYDL